MLPPIWAVPVCSRSGMDILSQRIGMLERMLMEKLNENSKQDAAATASDMLDQKPLAVLSPIPAAVDPATACTAAALAVGGFSTSWERSNRRVFLTTRCRCR